MARPLPTAAYDYELPAGRVARYPAERRDGSRLLTLDRRSGAIRHRRFAELAELTRPGDAVILNETRVRAARLVGRKPTGAPGEVLLLRPASPADGEDAQTWVALVRPGGKLKPGRTLEVAEDLAVEILDGTGDGGRLVRLRSDLPIRDALARYGRVPLPPYLEREDEAADRDRYQTVYAAHTGSVAAPTAGLHFTEELLARIEDRGARLGRLTLHVGVGTFRPVDEEDPASHSMHAEWYDLPETTAALVVETRAAGGAVWAVGTTTVRALESAAGAGTAPRPGSGWTDLFIRPGYAFRAVDRLVTNFHLPRSTLLMLVAAFGGHEPVMKAYREAVETGYRFYSYGDAMALL
ncbi:MAG TPA: tRNA preQ1(34) S-adenosylmethionine ribosyltransferase-isomerase QueA [Longimicrobiales bacterium]|nr:tRNA preQ1(34) S-adenosylmethionine ribosyltransferase-isomerase QueA [Longimicrobiales bacterium]